MLFKSVADAEERERTVYEMTVVCYSNSATARLLPGDGMDAEGAVADAELALESDAKAWSFFLSFRVWLKNVLVDDKASAKRMEHIGGEWCRCCDEQRKKLGLPDVMDTILCPCTMIVES